MITWRIGLARLTFWVGLGAALLGGWPGEALAQILPVTGELGPAIPTPTIPEPQSQYAVKFVCGIVGGDFSSKLVGSGRYRTAINIHNPSNETVEYRFRSAQADLAADGPISPFTYGTTGPGGAQVFVCGNHIPVPFFPFSMIDGFFVIESRLPLDVTAVYTVMDYYGATSPPLTSSIHVDKIAARPKSSLCQKDIEIDLSRAPNWVRANGTTKAVLVPNVSIWDPSRTWMSYVATGNAGLNQNFIYQLNFCSCSSQGGTLNGDVKSDNLSTGVFSAPGAASTPVFATPVSGNFGTADMPATITSQTFTGGGNGSIVATVHNDTTIATGISFSGSLYLNYGHAGRCR